MPKSGPIRRLGKRGEVLLDRLVHSVPLLLDNPQAEARNALLQQPLEFFLI
jgi:hypothetical protein